jgi:hypothetical protein
MGSFTGYIGVCSGAERVTAGRSPDHGPEIHVCKVKLAGANNQSPPFLAIGEHGKGPNLGSFGVEIGCY